MTTGSKKAVYAALFGNLDTDKIVVTDLIEQKVMKVIPYTNKDHIFVEITRS